MQRNDQINSFLKQTDWADGTRSLLAGDASNRRYERVVQNGSGRTAVLMDAPRDKGEETRPFVEIARYLTGVGLRAPQVFAWDEPSGLVLLEDLGDDLFARVLDKTPESEATLYRAAVDVLVTLHEAAPPSDLLPYDETTMPELGALALDWYAKGADHDFGADQKSALIAELETQIADTHIGSSVLVQRDYHAENLLWLPDENGVSRVGLLDFQDARIGNPAYDLASLLEDARRDVSRETQEDMLVYYAQTRGFDLEAFRAAFAVQAAQRNLRILGVFARLSMHFGKPNYVDLIPRVWDHLQRDLAHPKLAVLRTVCADTLPPPTSDVLQRLKDKCATVPNL
ncbi:aminoglycoside phosphotransferase family protein [Nereida sp. MMG025]|uniref:aminoglycoside phosphotransferase family protein n=1 Tax=Nereida sp. MMG025 TaxID=2909981 RepID=UPI001F3DA2F0|nr:phosphotransferase [Nereida sp. MMG025]MCF6444639.1 phosphotransferase [Nereida sp. MMG025]